MLPIAPYGPVLKEERRIYHAHLSKELSQTLYRADIEAEACSFVLGVIQKGKSSSRDYDMFVRWNLLL